jgi:hypothetical protein
MPAECNSAKQQSETLRYARLLTLIKEDGSGKADANSYANRADGGAYHEGRLYATAWTGATEASRDGALNMATCLPVQWRLRQLREKSVQYFRTVARTGPPKKDASPEAGFAASWSANAGHHSCSEQS